MTEATASLVEQDRAADEQLRQRCTRFLHWHGRHLPADVLADLPADIAPDRYGEGGVVAELEAEVASLLGKPASVFMPSGTMAQQIALRIHAERSGRRTIGFHPTSHLELHEDKAYQRLHGLVGRPIGDARELLTRADLDGVKEQLAALLLELPQREIGGRLPAWDDLVHQVAWARDLGTATHLDGARIWECAPHYERSLADIAALFDTVYVSFYKGLGGLAGCCLAGPDDIVAEAREWRARQGGTLFALWPYAATARAGLRRRLPKMQQYADHARAVAAELRTLAGVDVVPDPPQTPMMHLHLDVEEKALRAAALRLAEDDGIWTWPRSAPTDSPRRRKVELVVGDATLEFSPEEVRGVVERLLSG